MKQDSLRGFDAESFEQFRMPQGELDHLPDFLDNRPKASNVLVRDPRDRSRCFLHLFADSDLRLVCDDDCFGGRSRARDDKVDLATHHAYRHIVSSCQDPAFQDLAEIFLSSYDPERFSWRQGYALSDLCLDLPNRDLVVY